MPIYVGSTKIGKVYVGSTAIGKVYKGSELVWESGPSLRLYGSSYNWSGNTVYSYVAGSWSTSGLVMKSVGSDKITAITGTLGTNGSSIRVETVYGDYTFVYNATYNKTNTVNGINVYLYIDNSSYFTTYFSVMEGSKVDSTILSTSMQGEPVKPSSATSTTLVAGGTTYTRDTSRDATWYLTGVK